MLYGGGVVHGELLAAASDQLEEHVHLLGAAVVRQDRDFDHGIPLQLGDDVALPTLAHRRLGDLERVAQASRLLLRVGTSAVDAGPSTAPCDENQRDEGETLWREPNGPQDTPTVGHRINAPAAGRCSTCGFDLTNRNPNDAAHHRHEGPTPRARGVLIKIAVLTGVSVLGVAAYCAAHSSNGVVFFVVCCVVVFGLIRLFPRFSGRSDPRR